MQRCRDKLPGFYPLLVNLFFYPKKNNIIIMDVDIKFCKSAFTHGYTEADIRLAIDNAIYDGYLEGDEDAENKRLLVGFDRRGNPIEIYYNILEPQPSA